MIRCFPLVFVLFAFCGDPLEEPAVAKYREGLKADQLQGFDAYARNNCHGCHGLNGDGTGPLNAGHRYSIPDFRNADTFRNGSDVSSIQHSIEFGVKNGKTGMQAYQNIPVEKREKIAEYIHSLANP